MQLKWDQPLSDELASEWILISQQLTLSRNTVIPRRYFPGNKHGKSNDYALHVFAYAAITQVYGACVYLQHGSQTSWQNHE